MKQYKPSNTSITLKGSDIVGMFSDSPVYLMVDGKVRILECVTFENHKTYLIAGKELEE